MNEFKLLIYTCPKEIQVDFSNPIYKLVGINLSFTVLKS